MDPKQRTWSLEPDEFGNPPSMDALQEAFAEAAAIVGRLGGAIVVAAPRLRIDQGEGREPVFLPHRYVFKWSSFVPSDRAAESNGAGEPVEPIRVGDEPEPEPQPEPEPESVT